MLPCRKFATEFLKQCGHERVFQLVERFHTPERKHSVQISHDWGKTLWPSVVSCLTELAEYGINSSLEVDPSMVGNDEEEDENESTLIWPNTDVSKPVVDGGVQSRMMDELFSWKLASNKFLSVLIQQCYTDFGLETLRDVWKIILVILVNCPDAADHVIAETGPDFIFRLLQRVLPNSIDPRSEANISTLSRPFDRSAVSPTTASGHCSRSNSISSEVIHLPHPVNNKTLNTGSVQNDLISLLLNFIYAILYHLRHGEAYEEQIADYLGPPRLAQLAQYIPQPQRTRPSTEQTRSSTSAQVRPNLNSSPRFGDGDSLSVAASRRSDQPLFGRRSSSSSGGQSPFFHPELMDRSSSTGVKPKSALMRASVPETGFDWETSTREAFIRLQHLQFVHLAAQLNEPLNPTSDSTADPLLTNLCMLAAGGSSQTLDMEKNCLTEQDYVRWGFKHPQDVIQDFCAPPGKLGFRLLNVFIRNSPVLTNRMLSYTGDGKLYDSAPSHRSWCGDPLDDRGYSCSSLSQHNGRRHADSVAKEYSNRPQSTETTVGEDPKLVGVRENRFASLPSFPFVSASNAVTVLLCDILGINRIPNLEPLTFLNPKTGYNQLSHFYPFLFRPRDNGLLPFEDLFVITFTVFFYTWTQLNASTHDLPVVLPILREQLLKVLSNDPESLDAFEHLFTRYTPHSVRADWKERDMQNRTRLLQTHPALRELNTDLAKLHELTVREQRLNVLSYRAPLDYVPLKNSKPQGRDSQKLEVVLSPDRKSLVLRDSNHCTKEIWLLVCIDRVTSGLEEKVKKYPDRTLVLHMRVREAPEPIQIHLLARTAQDYKYWTDGFRVILNRGPKSDQFDSDIKRLIELDVKIRLSALSLYRIPTKPRPIPPDPPEFDFDEEGDEAFPSPIRSSNSITSFT